MALSAADAMRITFKMIQTLEVTTDTNYESTKLDYLDAATSLKWADKIIDVYGPIRDSSGAVIVSPTNDQKAIFVRNQFRRWLRGLNKSASKTSAIDTLDLDAVADAADAETNTDLGLDDVMP